MEKSDQALVRAFIRRRDEASFRALYRRYSPRMISLARVITRKLNGADVEDVLQETWVRAARGLRCFEWRSSLSSWLCGILINVCRETVRKEHRAFVDDEPFDLSEKWSIGLDPVDVISLADALQDLSKGYRKIVLLHDVGGFTHDEIGTLLGIDSGTSKSQLSRARSKLRDRLRGREGE